MKNIEHRTSNAEHRIWGKARGDVCPTGRVKKLSAWIYLLSAIAFVPNLAVADAFLRVEHAGRTYMGSTLNHGFQVLVFDDRFTDWTTPDAQLSFAVVTTNQPMDIWIRRQPEYAYLVELFDANGTQVPKTEAGKKAGSKFFQLDPGNLHTGMRLEHSVADKPEKSLAPFPLFKIKDMFDVTNSGNYTLRVRFQFFERVSNGTNTMFRVVRFLPMDCPVRNETSSK